nr:MAG TPA: hypothetical protein [Caudoviricetes sp.]
MGLPVNLNKKSRDSKSIKINNLDIKYLNKKALRPTGPWKYV